MVINFFIWRNCCEKPQESGIFLNDYYYFRKEVIMGSPACGRDVLAEHGSMGDVKAP